jgi:hypothetical protein
MAEPVLGSGWDRLSPASYCLDRHPPALVVARAGLGGGDGLFWFCPGEHGVYAVRADLWRALRALGLDNHSNAREGMTR